MLVDELLKFNSPDTFLRAVLCLLCASQMPEVRVTWTFNSTLALKKHSEDDLEKRKTTLPAPMLRNN